MDVNHLKHKTWMLVVEQYRKNKQIYQTADAIFNASMLANKVRALEKPADESSGAETTPCSTPGDMQA